MFGRLRDLLTGFLVVAIAFGLVGQVLRRPVGPRAVREPLEPERPAARSFEREVSASADARFAPPSASARAPASISAGSGFAMALLGAAPILLALYSFGGRADVPLASRWLVVVAVAALAVAATVLVALRPVRPRHAAAAVAAIAFETAAVIAALVVDAVS